MNQTVRRQLPSEDTVRSLYCILTSLILLIVFQTTAVASVFLPVGLNAGDTYQLVFLSQGETAATSSSISYYNDFAQSQAELNSLTGYEDGVTYNAIVSTSAVEARNNALVSAPVYNFNGELVANGSADLWDGSLSARINYDQTGTELGGHHVWTGSTSSGEAWAGFELGAGDNAASGGSGRDSNGKWIALKNTFSSTGSNSIYALSSVITVPGSEPEPDPVPPTTVPEPASVVAWSLLGVIGCIGTWWNRRRKVA